jgi:uncharacterized Fe-S cluster-containing MiaB family protein
METIVERLRNEECSWCTSGTCDNCCYLMQDAADQIEGLNSQHRIAAAAHNALRVAIEYAIRQIDNKHDAKWVRKTLIEALEDAR